MDGLHLTGRVPPPHAEDDSDSALVGRLDSVAERRFRRYDFVSMYALRLVYYRIWHIAKQPMLDMSLEQIRMMEQGMRVDGSQAARELGIAYTPIRTALEEMLAPLRRDGDSPRGHLVRL